MIPLPRLLDNSGNEVRRLHPIKVSISENIVPLSTASMQLMPEEQIPERSYVELFTVNGSAGIYIAKKPYDSYGNISSSISLEHAVSDVGNWIVKADIEKVKKTLAQALTRVFAYYGGSKWQLGTVSVNADVVLSASYDNLLSKMNSLIADVPSAMMTFDFSTSPWTINVVSRGSMVQAEGRLSRNIMTAAISKDDSSLCTRVYMNGLGTGGAVGYRDADTVSAYGVIENYITGDTYTAEQAEVVAQQYLNAHKRPKYSVDISMMDLYHVTGETLDKMVLGKLYRLVIPEENVTVEENIISIYWDDVYGIPEQATVTLSEEETTLTTFLEEQNKAVNSSLYEGFQHIEKKDAEWTTKFEVTDRSISSLVQKTGVNDLGDDETLYSKITQTEQGITTEVAKKLDKTADFTTVDSIIAKALQDAQDAATTAANGRIAKTAVYQTADAIVTAAAAEAVDTVGNSFIAKTSTYQTADAIVTAAETYVNGELQNYSTTTQTAQAISTAVGTKLDKTSTYDTIDKILNKANQDAEAAAATAASGCIAKTTTYQSATAIVNAAVAQAATAAGNTYIAKTTTYQTADAIVTAAESYVDGELTNYSTTSQTAQAISTAVGSKLDKTATYDTIDKILNKANTDAQGYANTAASGCIAKTSTYQTATAIVNAAVAQAATSAGNTYIAKTSTYQTADAIVTAAEGYVDGQLTNYSTTTQTNNKIATEVGKKLDKTTTYDTIDKILNKANTDAQGYATTAAAGCIAKTSTYQTADAIVTNAVAQAATAAGNTYIARTSTYQTADAIVSAAESYTDGEVGSLQSTVTQNSNKIALVVTQSSGQDVVNAAGIVAAVNSSGSSVKINASKINLAGNVSITDLSEYNSELTGGTLSVQHNLFIGGFISCGASGMFDDGMIVGSHLKGVNGISLGQHYFSLGYIYAAGDAGESPSKHNVVFWT